MKILCQAILFDMDGVLVDSTPAVARVWSAWARKHGFDPEDTVRRAHGRPSLATIREMLPNSDAIAEDRQVEQAEIADVDGVIALPGSAHLIDALPPDRYAVVTSATRALAMVRLQAAAFAVPKHIITCDVIQHGKPHPEPYLRGAAALALAPADCVVIEDAPAGVQSGKSAGCRVIGLRTTTSDPELFDAGADYIVGDCSALSLAWMESGEICLTLNKPSARD